MGDLLARRSSVAVFSLCTHIHKYICVYFQRDLILAYKASARGLPNLIKSRSVALSLFSPSTTAPSALLALLLIKTRHHSHLYQLPTLVYFTSFVLNSSRYTLETQCTKTRTTRRLGRSQRILTMVCCNGNRFRARADLVLVVVQRRIISQLLRHPKEERDIKMAQNWYSTNPHCSCWCWRWCLLCYPPEEQQRKREWKRPGQQ